MPPDKTGTVSAVSSVLKDKTGTPPSDRADAHLDQTGTESPVSVATVEDNGTAFQSHAPAHQETGTDSPAFSAPPVKHGTPTLFHVHVQPALTGTDLNAEPAQAPTDTGTTN